MMVHSSGVIGVEDLPDSIREGRAIAQVASTSTATASSPALALDGMRDQIADMIARARTLRAEGLRGSLSQRIDAVLSLKLLDLLPRQTEDLFGDAAYRAGENSIDTADPHQVGQVVSGTTGE